MALSPVRLRASMSVGSADTIAFTRSNSPALIASMKAAPLEVVSGMHRSYPGCGATAGLKACTTCRVSLAASQVCAMPVVLQTFRFAVIVTVFLTAATARGQVAAAPPQEQTAAPSHDPSPLGVSFTADALGALPTSASLFPLLTSVAEVIGDRIDTG